MEIATLEKKDLQYADNLALTPKQLEFLLKKTPKEYIKTRPGKGGQTWDYVAVSYFIKVLNLMFGWNWSFEVIDEKILKTQVIVKGKLTCRTGDIEIVKMQYGRKDIAFRKGSDIPLDIGNDLKASASDSLKKCASLIGIASDIYGKESFREVKVVDPDKEKDRIIDWINSSESLEKLSMVNENVYASEDDTLISLYEKKVSEWKSKK